MTRMFAKVKSRKTYETIRNSYPSLPAHKDYPMSSPQMDEASSFMADMINDIRNNQESQRLVLLGDFDCDGASSTAIMYYFSKIFGIKDVMPLLSNRAHGYGLPIKTIDVIRKAAKGEVTKLNKQTALNPEKDNYEKIDKEVAPENCYVILMDLGVKEALNVKILLEEGFKVLVLDHHLPSAKARAEWAMVSEMFKGKVHIYDPYLSPKDSVDYQVFTCLSAAAVTFKVAKGITDKRNNFHGLGTMINENKNPIFIDGKKKYYLSSVFATMVKICAIALAADCMPFQDDEGNLTYAHLLSKEFEKSVAEINRSRNLDLDADLMPGLQLLNQFTHTSSRIPWSIGPVINAPGRRDKADFGFQLLIATNMKDAQEYLNICQIKREEVREQTGLAALNIARDLKTAKGVAILVGNNDEIDLGSVGVGAARAAEQIHAPSLYMLAITGKDGSLQYKGSMRAGETDFSCEYFINEVEKADMLVSGGGHKGAAGLTVKGDRFEEFLALAESQKFNRIYPKVYVETDFTVFQKQYKADLMKVLPFGRLHQSAIFSLPCRLIEVSSKETNKVYGKVPEPTIDDKGIAHAAPKKRFGYGLRMVGVDSMYPELSIMVNMQDCSSEQIALLDSLVGKKLDLPFEIKMEYLDKLKLDSDPSKRLELSIMKTKVELTNGVMENRAAFQVLSEETLKKVVSGEMEPVEGIEATMEELDEMLSKPVKNTFVLQIDCDTVNNSGNVFTVARPFFKKIIENYGIEVNRKMESVLGGRVNRETYLLEISASQALKLMQEGSDSYEWDYKFTKNAQEKLKELFTA